MNKYNQPMNNWNVCNVSCFEAMFRDAVSFDQDLNKWDIINASFIEDMFKGCKAFKDENASWINCIGFMGNYGRYCPDIPSDKLDNYENEFIEDEFDEEF